MSKNQHAERIDILETLLDRVLAALRDAELVQIASYRKYNLMEITDAATTAAHQIREKAGIREMSEDILLIPGYETTAESDDFLYIPDGGEPQAVREQLDAETSEDDFLLFSGGNNDY